MSRKRPFPIWSWRSPVGPLVTVPFFLIFIVAVFAPINVLDESGFANWIGNVGRKTLLRVNDLADLKSFADSTAYPQIALLISAMHWMLLPITLITLLILGEIGVREDRWQMWLRTRGGIGAINFKEVQVIMAGLLIFCIASVVATIVPGEWSLARGLTTQSRVGMGAMLGLVFFGLSQIMNGAYVLLRAFIHFNVKNKVGHGRNI